MKKIILAVVAVLAFAAPLTITASPASANPSCMSRTEFTHIHKGQTLARVRHIVGSKGMNPIAGTYQWFACAPPGALGRVLFNGHNLVKAKHWFAPCLTCSRTVPSKRVVFRATGAEPKAVVLTAGVGVISGTVRFPV